jgi:hypothetical protein
MLMITDFSPTDASSDVSVFAAPEATFAVEMGKAFEVQDDDGNEKRYRIQLKEFVLNDGEGNVIGELKWNSDKNAASFNSHEVLPPEKEITATVSVNFEEYKNNRWNKVYTGGKEALEIKTVKFTTGTAPDYIPVSNIVYSYPVVNQKYFLKNESEKGYIQLRSGQDYLFPAEYKTKVSIEDGSGNRYLADFTYNQPQKRIDFTMPQIANSTQYKFNILSFNTDTTQMSGGVSGSTSIIDESLSGEYGNIDVESQTATAENRTDLGKNLLNYDFATSKYSTFEQKINGIVKDQAGLEKIESDVLMFFYLTKNMEPFDLAELVGVEHTENQPLVSLEATLDDNFYKQKIYPLVYEDYPVQGVLRLTHRTQEPLGIPPAKALPLSSEYLTAIENNLLNGIAKTKFPYFYNLPQEYKRDMRDLQNQVVNKYQNDPSNPAYKRFVQASFPFINPEQYRVKLQYTMPGGIKGTSAIFEYKNFIE